YDTFVDDRGIQENLDLWSIQYKKDLCRIVPAYFSRDEIEERNSRTAKLTGLPFGTTPIDLKEILKQFNAKTCFIPRTRSRYHRCRFAYISFENNSDLIQATVNTAIRFGAGYTMEFKPTKMYNSIQLKEEIFHIAYMDDTTWLAPNKNAMSRS